MSEYCAGGLNSSNSLVYSNACNSTRWLTEEVFSLIDLVQRNEAIYNPRHKYYFCRPYVENFWREVDNKLEKNPGASLAKWTNLRISFRREYTNYLEEKVPPCWTYFDRMFFLHPYLRKKHQQLRPLDGQIQDALAQFSTISGGRLSSTKDGNGNADLNPNEPNSSSSSVQLRKATTTTTSSTSANPLETYLEYLDEVEPTPSELDDMNGYEETSNEPGGSSGRERRRYPSSTSALVNDIKSECEDNVDEFETDHNAGGGGGGQALADDDPEPSEDEHLLNSLVLDNLEKRQQQQQQRLQHIQRLHSRALYEDFCVKRLRQQETMVSGGGGGGGTGGSQQNPSNSALSSMSSANTCSTHNNSNVSLVRPTLAKQADSGSNAAALTTTNVNNPLLSNTAGQLINNNNSSSSSNNNNHNNNGNGNNSMVNAIMSSSQTLDSVSSNVMNAVVNSRLASGSSHYHHNHHHHHPMMHSNRYEMSLVTPSNCSNLNTNTLTATANSTPELCDCKTDPDAMFLMSLLPDIQKLNGRDRGKIKIAFQNILQDFLYPD